MSVDIIDTTPKKSGWIEGKVTVGNLITIVLIVASVIFTYASMQGRLDTVEKNLEVINKTYVNRDALDGERYITGYKLDDLKSRMERIERKLDQIK